MTDYQYKYEELVSMLHEMVEYADKQMNKEDAWKRCHKKYKKKITAALAAVDKIGNTGPGAYGRLRSTPIRIHEVGTDDDLNLD